MLKFINTGGKIGFCDMPVKKKNLTLKGSEADFP